MRRREDAAPNNSMERTAPRAADCLFSNHSAAAVRQEILANPADRDFALIGSVELGTSWLHFDVRNCDRVKQYYP